MSDPYVTDDASGRDWHLMLGDSCERLAEVGTETVDLSVCSPPFASLYVYSPTIRDLGNCASREEFLEHYGFVIREQLRATKPGRLSCVHVQQITTTKVQHGVMGLTDFRGEVIRAHLEAGWVFHGEVTVDKDPQAQAIRTKTASLLFVQLYRDSTVSRPALADYVLLFRKPGENATPVRPDIDQATWVRWASPIWTPDDDDGDDAILATAGLLRCWYGIRETDTLNVAVARDEPDERHIVPLQLSLIDRCIRLWSNVGDLVLSPFAGIGSEGYVALKNRRRFVGIELKASYWSVARRNLESVSRQEVLL